MRAVAVACLLLGASTAHAFSDPDMFGMPVAAGGGGGRQFTGSRADAYSCSVCHTGAREPKVVIDGLPDKLVTGERYALVVTWDQPEVPLGLQLELSTPSGSHPSVEVAAAADLPGESHCEQDPAGPSAIYTHDVGTRRIVGVADCLAARLDVSFVASGEPIVLAIGAVRSDSSGTVDGDGTYERRIWVGTHLVVTGGGGCDATSGSPGLGLVWLLLAASAVRAARARRGS